MQTVSSGWAGAVSAPFRKLGYSAQIAWSAAVASGVNFFTIGTSTIGGPDILKSGGGAVAFWDKYAYSDYTRYVLSINIKRALGQYPYGTIMAQADVEMDNASKLFLPGFDATIGSGIAPNRPIKLSLGLNNEYMQQFVGFAGLPENDITSRVAAFHAFDAMNYIAGFKSTASGAQVNQYSTQIMTSLMGEMGFAANQFVLDASLQQPIGYMATYDQKAGDIIQNLCEAEQGIAFIDENGIFRFWNRQHFTTTSGVAAFNFNFQNISDLQYQNTPIINDVIVKAEPRAVQANQKIWELSGPITLLPGESKLYKIDFTDDDGELPITAFDIPLNLPNSTTSYYVANYADDGSGADASSLVHVSSCYSYGNQLWITFTNTSPSSTVYITQVGIWGTPAKITAHISQAYKDQASIDQYGRNPANNGEPLEITNNLIQDASTANSLARTLVYEYKDPRKRYVLPVAVNSNPALQIGDFGTLYINDTGETKNVWVVGKEEKLDRSRVYTQTLEVEERNIKHYFTIGVSTIEGDDPIAP